MQRGIATMTKTNVSRRGFLGGAAGAALATALAVGGRDPHTTVAADASAATVGGPLDFPLVAYQGDDLLGGHQTTFANVFAQSKPVVLNFWAPLCPPCKDEMPTLQRYADQYADQLIFVGVDVGTFFKLGDHANAQQFLADNGIRYPVAYATNLAPLQQYKILALPSTAYLTATGNILGVTGVLGMNDGQLQSVLTRLAAGM